jgi:hypothetical protein
VSLAVLNSENQLYSDWPTVTPTPARGDGTHEWMKIQTDDAAKYIATKARSEKPTQKQFLRYGSRQKSVRKPYRKRQINSTETTTTIDISSVTPTQPSREARPSNGAVASGAAATNTPPSPASEPLAASERADILLSRVAGRLGSGQDGWLIVDAATEPELDNLMVLEARGKLDAATLAATRHKYRRGAAWEIVQRVNFAAFRNGAALSP